MDEDFKLNTNFVDPVVHWCPSQALFALYSRNSSAVEIYRVTFEVEKICEKFFNSHPLSLALTQDGCQCLIAFEDGYLGVYKTETLQEICKTECSTSQVLCVKPLPAA